MNVKEEFFRLKDRWIHSKGEERERADADMQAFFDSLTPEDNALLKEAVNEDFARIHQKVEESVRLAEQISIRKQLEEVLPVLSVSEFAKRYFGRSASWLHQRINGNAVHGKPAEFTPEEKQTLARALRDMASKLEQAAAAVA